MIWIDLYIHLFSLKAKSIFYHLFFFYSSTHTVCYSLESSHKIYRDFLFSLQVSELENLPQDASRSAYTQRILEIVSNIKKQKEEITKVDLKHLLPEDGFLRKNLKFMRSAVECSIPTSNLIRHGLIWTFDLKFKECTVNLSLIADFDRHKESPERNQQPDWKAGQDICCNWWDGF